MTSVGEILDYKKRGDEDYYAILGCNENSTVSRQNVKFINLNRLCIIP